MYSLDAMRLLITDPRLFKTMGSGPLGYRRNHFDVWYEVVQHYSIRNLSISSDKLLAIAGIAKLMQKHFSCEYGAGLWKEDLPSGLCWYVGLKFTDDNVPLVEDNEPRDQSQPEYIAPSWSWASVIEKKINFHNHARWESGDIPEVGAQVLSWNISYPNEAVAPFSQVLSGVLTIKGHIREVLVKPVLKEEEAMWWYEDPLWQAHSIDPLTTSRIGEVMLDTFKYYQELVTRQHALQDSEKESAELGGLASGALPAMCLLVHVVEKYERRHMLGLVLVPHHVDKHMYKRIGLFYAEEPVLSPDGSILGTFVGTGDENRQTVHIL
jgi:hypothetical protein